MDSEPSDQEFDPAPPTPPLTPHPLSPLPLPPPLPQPEPRWPSELFDRKLVSLQDLVFMLVANQAISRRKSRIRAAYNHFPPGVDPQETTLLQAISDYFDPLLAVLAELRRRLVVLQRRQYSSGRMRNYLVLDTRHGCLTNEDKAETLCLHLDRDGYLLKRCIKTNGLPKISAAQFQSKRFSFAAPLLKWLRPYTNKPVPPDPQTLEELKDFVPKYAPPKTEVVIMYLARMGTNIKDVKWYRWNGADPRITVDDEGHEELLHRVLYLEARATSDYKIAYQVNRADENRFTNWKAKQDQDFERYSALLKELDKPNPFRSNPSQANRAAALSFYASGVNLAWELGLINAAERNHLTRELAATAASVVFHLCDQGHLRFASYFDLRGGVISVEVICYEDRLTGEAKRDLKDFEYSKRTGEVMVAFFTKIWARREQLADERKKILAQLMERLEPWVRDSEAIKVSPYTRLARELKDVVLNQQVFYYCRTDNEGHAVKGYLAHFLYTKQSKRNRGLRCFFDTHSDLVAFGHGGIAFTNLFHFLDCKKDADLFGEAFWMSPPVIPHVAKSLHNCRMVMPDGRATTLQTYCHQRGNQLASHLLDFWIKFSDHNDKFFGVSIPGMKNLVYSVPFLCFTLVWRSYLEAAGPMHQAPEKIKPYYDQLLRGESRSGFMYSAEAEFISGQPLTPDLPDSKVSAIFEADIVSSYGFCGSRARLPGGFCVGFVSRKETDAYVGKDPKLKEDLIQTDLEDQEGNDHNGGNLPDEDMLGCLPRTDPRFRHRTFEFRAVYKTVLDHLQHHPEVKIRTVYSNFHGAGIFFVGGHPLDLAIISENNQIWLYNFDGR